MPGEPVVVVGGGLSGLTCAFELVRRGREAVVLEAAERPGGVCGTTEADGFRFEHGPHTVQASAAAFRRLCGELGIADRLVASEPAARRRFLLHGGRLRALPGHPLGILTTPVLSPRARLRLLREPLVRWRPPAPGEPEPTLAAFLEERLGREPTRRLAGAFVRGVYAGSLDALGARSAFPRLWELARRHGGLVRGLVRARREPGPPLPGPAVRPSRLLSFPGGLQELVDALAAALGERLRTGARAVELGVEPGGVRVGLADGSAVRGTDAVLATPARPAAGLLRSAGAGGDVERVARLLDGLPLAGVALVHLGFDADPGLPDGFGFLVPPDEPDAPAVLGAIFASRLFARRAPPGGAALSAFYPVQALDGLDDAAAGALARRELGRALGGGELPAPRVVRVLRWPAAIPQYGPGHADRIAAAEADLARALPGAHLAGNYAHGIGVEQVVARGVAVADRILRHGGVPTT